MKTCNKPKPNHLNHLIYLLYILADMSESTVIDLKTHLLDEDYDIDKNFRKKISEALRTNRNLLKGIQTMDINSQYTHGEFTDGLYEEIKEKVKELLK